MSTRPRYCLLTPEAAVVGELLPITRHSVPVLPVMIGEMELTRDHLNLTMSPMLLHHLQQRAMAANRRRGLCAYQEIILPCSSIRCRTIRQLVRNPDRQRAHLRIRIRLYPPLRRKVISPRRFVQIVILPIRPFGGGIQKVIRCVGLHLFLIA